MANAVPGRKCSASSKNNERKHLQGFVLPLVMHGRVCGLDTEALTSLLVYSQTQGKSTANFPRLLPRKREAAGIQLFFFSHLVWFSFYGAAGWNPEPGAWDESSLATGPHPLGHTPQPLIKPFFGDKFLLSCSTAQAGLRLIILLPQPLRYQASRHIPPHLPLPPPRS